MPIWNPSNTGSQNPGEQPDAPQSHLPSLIQSFFASQLNDVYAKARQAEDRPMLETLLENMRVEWTVDSADRAQIPASGPVVAICNHPFGILDGAILMTMLSKVRSDVKILSNYFLSAIPEFGVALHLCGSVPAQRD